MSEPSDEYGEVITSHPSWDLGGVPMPRYECDCCGACCEGHLIVEAYELDVLREPRLIAADPFYAHRDPDEALAMLADDDRCVVLAAGRACPFLNAEKRCSIYPTRPNCCVTMQAGDEQCQEARSLAGLPPLEPIDR